MSTYEKLASKASAPPWAMVMAEYADGYVGYDLCSVPGDEQEDVVEKVPEADGALIVALVNAGPDIAALWDVAAGRGIVCHALTALRPLFGGDAE